MKYRYVALSLGLVFLLLLVPSIGLVAAPESDGGLHYMTWAPERLFEAFWFGTSLQNESGIQFWNLELEPSLMMMTTEPSSMMVGTPWVEMTLKWDPLAQTGEVIEFRHFGMNLLFTGWGGNIWFNPVYHFWFGGHGVGTYNDSGTLYPCDIWGWFNGTYYPDDPENPFRNGLCGYSNFTEYATLRWGYPPVGGEVIPVDNMAVLSPYLALLVLVSAVSVTAAFVIRRKPLY